jgi:tetrapyrrole methylase family protein/MazG family protein
VTLVRAAGTAQAEARNLPLYELDRRGDIDHLTSLYVPPLPQPGSLAAFQQVVARLRAADGCPWDREQTHSSLRPYLLEETYEVLQALDREDLPALTEELGDLLLQVLLHTQIAIEDAEFRMADVVSHIVAKLQHRHPHVFGDVQVADSQEVLVNWERIKSQEKNHPPMREGVFSRVPQQLPALTRASSLQERAARLGFEWADIEGAWRKFEEESRELQQAEGSEARSAELGDVLFAVVSLARWMGMDAECALREATARFAARFEQIVRDCAARGQPLETLSRSQWVALWERSKKERG